MVKCVSLDVCMCVLRRDQMGTVEVKVSSGQIDVLKEKNLLVWSLGKKKINWKNICDVLMNGWMSFIFRTKVPEISGGHNGRQDQLFRVDARAHRPPLHGAHSIYQSKFNHLEQITLVTFISVRLTLRLSVFLQLYFKVPDMTLSGCCLDQHSVQVYSAAKPRIITCRITTNFMLNSFF